MRKYFTRWFRIMSGLLAIIIFSVIIWFYLIYTRPSRLPDPLALCPQVSRPEPYTESLFCRLSERLSEAKYESPGLREAYRDLAGFRYFALKRYMVEKRDPRYQVSAIGEIETSVQSRDAVYAPAATTVTYELPLPENPSLEFEYTLLSADPSAAAVFEVVISMPGQEKTVFSDRMMPVDDKHFKKLKGIRKIVEKYVKPATLYRLEKWRFQRIDLSAYSRKKVRVIFRTKSDGSSAAFRHSFWGNPRIYTTVPKHAGEYNIIYVIGDALNTGMLGCYGSNLGLTPNIDSFSANALQLQDYFSSGVRTRLAVMPLFTGRYLSFLYAPQVFLVSRGADDRFYARKIISLPKILEENGYTCAMISNNMFLIGATGVGIDIGFPEIHDFSRHHYSSIDVTTEIVRWLSENKNKKFFLYVHYDTTHPYERPPLRNVAKSIFSKDPDRRLYYLKYKAQVSYVDDYFGKLMEAVDRMGLRENTIIVFSADHGKPVSVLHCQRLHGEQVLDSGAGFYDDEMRVPFIISYPAMPNAEHNRKIAGQVSSVDTMPFLLELAGIKPPQDMNSRNISRLMKDEIPDKIVAAENAQGKAIRDGQYKYIRWKDGFAQIWKNADGKSEAEVKEELYDLRTDPAETVNLAGTRPDILKKMQKEYDEFYLREPKVNRLFFQGNRGDVLTCRVKASGKIIRLSPLQEPAVTALCGQDCEFKLDKEGEILFETIPAESCFSVELFLNNRRMPEEKILTGKMSLPLKSNPLKINPENDDLLLVSEQVIRKIDQSAPWVHFSRIPFGDWTWPAKEETMIPDLGVKTVLQGWGYIQTK